MPRTQFALNPYKTALQLFWLALTNIETSRRFYTARTIVPVIFNLDIG